VRRLSIARSVQLALLGLTIALTAIAGFGVGALYSSRQHYEDQLAHAFEVKASAGKLLAASVVEEATLRAPRADRTATSDARAKTAYLQSLQDTRRRAADDPRSVALVEQAGAAQARLRRPSAPAGAALAARAPISALSRRQDERLAKADDAARDDSRQALASITAAGGLALAGAIALVALLLAARRRPAPAGEPRRRLGAPGRRRPVRARQRQHRP
jgi:hypothetical protein